MHQSNYPNSKQQKNKFSVKDQQPEYTCLVDFSLVSLTFPVMFFFKCSKRRKSLSVRSGLWVGWESTSYLQGYNSSHLLLAVWSLALLCSKLTRCLSHSQTCHREMWAAFTIPCRINFWLCWDAQNLQHFYVIKKRWCYVFWSRCFIFLWRRKGEGEKE